MRRSTGALVVALAGGVLAAGGFALWSFGGGEPEESRSAARTPPPRTAEPPPPPEDDPFAIPPDQLAALMEKLREIEAEASEPGEGDEPPPPPPTQVHYSVPQKYETQVLSEVPHRLLGAWDEAGEEEAPGRHRSFVLVVDPDLSDRRLEALARDVHRLHHDADRLDVRIYDRENAATDSRVSDGGKYAHRHQVARVTRHRGLGVDVIRVRGRVVGP